MDELWMFGWCVLSFLGDASLTDVKPEHWHKLICQMNKTHEHATHDKRTYQAYVSKAQTQLSQ